MYKTLPILATCVLSLTFFSCSKKTQPSASTNSDTAKVNTAKGADTAATKKVIVKYKPKPLPTVPKVLVVNDATAKRSVDGRLYYDLQGRRYWRSNKDGKYYLFNKSMQNDEAFKAPVKKSK